MCGIVGYVGPRPASPLLIEGLARLEYRGYDSAGLAVVGASKMRVWKAVGRVRDLQAALPKRIAGGTGIAHTRWATHGAPQPRQRTSPGRRHEPGRRRAQRDHRERERAAGEARG